MKLTEEKIRKISEKLKTIPKKNKFTKREAVELLRDDIASLQGKGYSLKEIKNFLDEEGLKMSLATLRSYIPCKKQKIKTPKPNRKKKVSGKEDVKVEKKAGFVEPDPEEI